MSAVKIFIDAFLDFQEHGKRDENSILAYEVVRMRVDKRRTLGPDIKGEPFNHEDLLDYIVSHWKQRHTPLFRLPSDRGYLFVK